MKKIDKQKLLLRFIFKSCGGPTELQKITGITRHNFTNWQVRGKVPLRIAVRIAESLGISKWGLSYAEFCEVSEDFPTWEEVVNSYFLPKVIVDKLLEESNKSCQKKKKLKKKKKRNKKNAHEEIQQ